MESGNKQVENNSQVDAEALRLPAYETKMTWQRVDWMVLAGLFALSFLLYGMTVNIPLIYDDVDGVLRNQEIQQPLTLKEVVKLLTSSGSNKTYRPIRDITYLIDYNLWGLDKENRLAKGFHITNVFLHGLTCAAVYWLFGVLWRRRMTAAIGAFFFAVCAVHAEAVSVIVGRKEMLFTIFALLAFGFFVLDVRVTQAADGGRRRAPLYAILAAVCLFVSVLAKQMSAVYPLLFALYIWLFPEGQAGDLRQRARAIGRHVLPLVAVVVLYFLLWKHFSQRGPLAKGAVRDTWAFYLDACWAQLTYLRLLLIPRAWVLDYDGFTMGYSLTGKTFGEVVSLLGGDYRFWLMIAGLGGLLGWTGWACYRVRSSSQAAWAPHVAFWLLHYILLIITVGNFFFRLATGMLAERYLYLPSLSLAALLALGFTCLWDRAAVRAKRALLVVGLAVLFAGNAAVALWGGWIAQSEREIWRHAHTVTPTNRRAAISEAMAFWRTAKKEQGDRKRQDLDQVVQMLQKVLQKYPHDVVANKNMVVVLQTVGRLEEIPPVVEKLVEAYPSDPALDSYVKFVVEPMLLQKDGARAEAFLRRILPHRLDAVAWHAYLAKAYALQNKNEKAQIEIQWVLQREPQHLEMLRLQQKLRLQSK